MAKPDRTGDKETDDATRLREKKEQAGNAYAMGNKMPRRRNIAMGIPLGTGRRVKPTK